MVHAPPSSPLFEALAARLGPVQSPISYACNRGGGACSGRHEGVPILNHRSSASKPPPSFPQREQEPENLRERQRHLHPISSRSERSRRRLSSVLFHLLPLLLLMLQDIRSGSHASASYRTHQLVFFWSCFAQPCPMSWRKACWWNLPPKLENPLVADKTVAAASKSLSFPFPMLRQVFPSSSELHR